MIGETMLKFSRDAARKDYEARDNNFPRSLIDHLLLQHELLARNKLFVEEWERLDDLVDCPEYEQARKEFEKRWNVNHPGGLYNHLKLPSSNVWIVDSRIEQGKIVIEIDLNGSINKIMSQVAEIVKPWHDEFFERLGPDNGKNDDYLYMKFWDEPNDTFREEYERNWKQPRKDGNVKENNFNDYYRYLEIWDAKNDGLSWSEVAEKFGPTTIDKFCPTTDKFYLKKVAVRNYYRSIEKCIAHGLPGFPPFPA